MDYHRLPAAIQNKILELPTPFFLFDLDMVKSNYHLVKSIFPVNKIYYALKSNGLHPVLDTLAGEGCCFEANNMAELKKAVDAGVDPATVINSSPITAAADIRPMHALGVSCFAFDSKNQIDNLAHNAPGARVYIRLGTTNEGSRLDLSKRLGAAPEEAPELIEYAESTGLRPYGVTFHVGSQCTNLENWRVGISEARKLFDHFPAMEMINLGGGLPVAYNEDVPGLREIAAAIGRFLDDFFPRRPLVLIEPGRFLVGNCGLTATSVIQLEERNPCSRVVVDMSVFCGFVEKLEFKNGFEYPVSSPGRSEPRFYTILGPTCDGEDVIAHNALLPRLGVDHVHPERSSRIFMGRTGAYTLEYTPLNIPHGFNGAKTPGIYFARDGRLQN